MADELYAPRRIMRKGSVKEIPKFDPVAELLKAGSYAKFGKSEPVAPTVWSKERNKRLDKILESLDGEMQALQIAPIAECSVSYAYKCLKKLGELGLVDSRKANINGRLAILFYRVA